MKDDLDNTARQRVYWTMQRPLRTSFLVGLGLTLGVMAGGGVLIVLQGLFMMAMTFLGVPMNATIIIPD